MVSLFVLYNHDWEEYVLVQNLVIIIKCQVKTIMSRIACSCAIDYSVEYTCTISTRTIRTVGIGYSSYDAIFRNIT
jgi:hypothetical protein